MVIPSILNRASLYFDVRTPTQAPASHPARGLPDGREDVRVSSRGASLAQQVTAVDQAKVDELKRRFSEGTYTVNPLQLAQAMLAKV